MPTFKPITSSTVYDAKTFDEMMKPHALIKNEYDKTEEQVDKINEGLAQFAPYIKDSDTASKSMYDSMMGKMNEYSKVFGTPYFAQSKPLLIQAKKDYARTSAMLNQAITAKKAAEDRIKKHMDSDPDYVWNYRLKNGNYSKEAGLDHFLNDEEPEFYGMSGKDALKAGEDMARSLSTRFAKAGAYVTYRKPDPNKPEAGLGEVVIQGTGSNHKKGLVANINIADLMDPQKAKAHIQNLIKQGHPELAGLLESTVAEDVWNAFSNSTLYGNMNDDNQNRLYNYYLQGVGRGMNGYDEAVNYNEQVHNPPTEKSKNGPGSKTPVTTQVGNRTSRITVHGTNEVSEEGRLEVVPKEEGKNVTTRLIEEWESKVKEALESNPKYREETNTTISNLQSIIDRLPTVSNPGNNFAFIKERNIFDELTYLLPGIIGSNKERLSKAEVKKVLEEASPELRSQIVDMLATRKIAIELGVPSEYFKQKAAIETGKKKYQYMPGENVSDRFQKGQTIERMSSDLRHKDKDFLHRVQNVDVNKLRTHFFDQSLWISDEDTLGDFDASIVGGKPGIFTADGKRINKGGDGYMVDTGDGNTVEISKYIKDHATSVGINPSASWYVDTPLGTYLIIPPDDDDRHYSKFYTDSYNAMLDFMPSENNVQTLNNDTYASIIMAGEAIKAATSEEELKAAQEQMLATIASLSRENKMVSVGVNGTRYSGQVYHLAYTDNNGATDMINLLVLGTMPAIVYSANDFLSDKGMAIDEEYSKQIANFLGVTLNIVK